MENCFMKDIEQAKRYLAMAEKDYRAVCGMTSSDFFSNEIFWFHVQQSVEKILKGWLCCLGVPVPRIHDLDELAETVKSNGKTALDPYLHLLAFTDFAVSFRYDVYLDIGEDLDRIKISSDLGSLLGLARKIVEEA